jgi:two-component system phosphate regulon sensor histidine kinase PhoR
MTARIFRSMAAVALCVLALCVAAVWGLLYPYYGKTVLSGLESTAAYVSKGIQASGADFLLDLPANYRAIWVSADGSVISDSESSGSAAESYAGSPEIMQALQTGTGRSEVPSDSPLRATACYAVRLDDGTVLRVSCVKDTAAAILLDALWPLVLIAALALALCGALASRVVRRVVVPGISLGLDRPEAFDTCRELEPLVSRLGEQNRTIRSQMDELGSKQREFAAITENMSEGFLLADHRANILSGNQSAMRLLSDDGSQVKNLRQANCRPEIRNATEAALAGRHTELVIRQEDRDYRVIVNPVISNGQVAGAVATMMDITEQEQREALRQEFTANVSHELKTPLTSISGFAELMKEGLVQPDKIRDFSGVIYSESRRLISLVDDIIELSKLDEDSKEFEFESVDLYDLADDVLQNLRPLAEKRRISLHLEGEHANISGVWQILDEMVYNLCDNAVKYNKDGGKVAVTVKKTGEQTSLTVADTGIGIPYAAQDRVFERFYRVDKSHSRAIGGTGLGLSIVKHGAQFHNARIDLHSEPDKGTAITLIFE